MSTAGFKLLPQSSGSQNDIVYTHTNRYARGSVPVKCSASSHGTKQAVDPIQLVASFCEISFPQIHEPLTSETVILTDALLSNIEVSEQDNPLKLWSKKHRPNRKNSLASRPSGHQSLPTHDEPRASHCSGKWKRSFGQGQQSWLSHSSPHTETSTT